MTTVEMLPDSPVMQETMKAPVEQENRLRVAGRWLLDKFMDKMDNLSVLLPDDPPQPESWFSHTNDLAPHFKDPRG